MTNSSGTYSGTECFNTGTSTKASTRFCCDIPKSFSTEAGNKENSLSCKVDTCKNFSEVANVPSVEHKICDCVRSCLSCNPISRKTQDSLGISVYSITDFKGQDDETLRKVCERPQISINKPQENIFGNETDFIQACNAVIVKCKELQENTFVNSGNSRNRIYYCVSPSVFEIKSALQPSKSPHKIVPKQNKTQSDTNNCCYKQLKFKSKSNSKLTEKVLKLDQQNPCLNIKSPPKLDVCLQKCHTYCTSDTAIQNNGQPVNTHSNIPENSEKGLDKLKLDQTCDTFLENKIEKENNLSDCTHDKHSISATDFTTESDQIKNRSNTYNNLSDCCKDNTNYRSFKPEQNNSQHDRPNTNNNLLDCCKDVTNYRSLKPEQDNGILVVRQSSHNTPEGKTNNISESLDEILKTPQPDQNIYNNCDNQSQKEDVLSDCCKINITTEKSASEYFLTTETNPTNNLPGCCKQDESKRSSKNSFNTEKLNSNSKTKSTHNKKNRLNNNKKTKTVGKAVSKPNNKAMEVNKSLDAPEIIDCCETNKESLNCNKNPKSVNNKVNTDVTTLTKNQNMTEPVATKSSVEESPESKKVDCCSLNKETSTALPESTNDKKPLANTLSDKPEQGSKQDDCKECEGENKNRSVEESPESKKVDCCSLNKDTSTALPESKNDKKPLANTLSDKPEQGSKQDDCKECEGENKNRSVEESPESKKVDCCSLNKDTSTALPESTNDKKPLANTLSDKPEQGSKQDDCKECEGENKIRYTEPIKRAFCEPQNCEKLNMPATKKWKSCCDEPKCPSNDPTTSTYNFLLKARICCNRRECQLAAKICDIYEPLVDNVDMKTSDADNLGDYQYHYLGMDVQTEYEDFMEKPEEEVNLSTPVILNLFDDDVDDEQVRDSIYIDPDEQPRRERRASTVSWNVPSVSLIETETEPESYPTGQAGISPSAEQVIAQATAEANKFRQTPQQAKTASVFGDIMKHKADYDHEPLELSSINVMSEDIFFKSQINGIHLSDSKHRTNW